MWRTKITTTLTGRTAVSTSMEWRAELQNDWGHILDNSWTNTIINDNSWNRILVHTGDFEVQSTVPIGRTPITTTIN